MIYTKSDETIFVTNNQLSNKIASKYNGDELIIILMKYLFKLKY